MRCPRHSPASLRVVVCLAAFAVGCASAEKAKNGKFPDYNVIRLYNDSPGEIYDVELSAGGTVTVLDRLPADHSPVSDRGVSPDPPAARVTWRTPDGQRYERQVPVAPDLPPGFRGVIVLRLTGTGDLGVTFVPYGKLR